jgi:beta-phosphoglucomutase-like phosphatase (HAD superfamily)
MSMQAVIFDMDGVIIDSEALWRQAQIDALAQWGATASVAECETLTKGKRLDDIAAPGAAIFSLISLRSGLKTPSCSASPA